MRRHFHKMHGLGNDFVIVDAREAAVRGHAGARPAIADRRTGVGCDQLILLEPSDTRRPSDAHLEQRRRRGRKLRQCHALRGPADRREDDRYRRRPARRRRPRRRGRSQRWSSRASAGTRSRSPMRWTRPRCRWPGTRSSIRWRSTSATRTWSSSCPTRDEIPLDELGPRIEHDPAFPERINVNVATYVDDGIKLRTWERGAGETLACGTGACATAVAAIVDQARAIAGQGRHDRRQPDDQLGAGRADPDARRRDPCVRGRARPGGACSERRDDHARLPAQLRRERDDRARRRRPTRTGSSSTAAP